MDQHATRGSVLRRGALLLAGTVGIGGAGAAGAAAAGTKTLTLYGRDFHLHSPGRRPGAVPSKGDTATTYGELFDRAGGTKVGEFRAAFLALGAPFGHGQLAADSLEQHVFMLEDGTIIGLGSATRGDGAFAIVGGTGRFAGARGTYSARMRTRELGGNGSAEFRLDLVI
jgi:hypothetical protein